MSELWRRSASELAALIVRKEASSREVLEAHLARIEAVNPKVNAIVKVLAKEARNGADEADRKLAAKEALGPLHGVPFTIKENIDLARHGDHMGIASVRARRRFPRRANRGEDAQGRGGADRSDQSSRHGAARSHPQFAARRHARSLASRTDRRRFKRGRSAALATGMSPLGLGNDIGGSLRNPANACGIASIRPSQGRVPDAGVIPGADRPLAVQIMQVNGPMARTVADVRLALQVISGAHPRDPWSLDPPAERPRDAAARRVAMVAEPPGGSTDPLVAETAGYVVQEVAPPRYEDAVSTWTALIVSDFRAVTDQLLPIMGKDGAFFFQTAGSSVPLLDAAGFSRLFFARDGIARAWSQFMADYGLILSPTWTQLPFEEGFDVASEDNVAATTEMIRPVVPANLIGLPSACVPAGLDPATGLPIGVLITGRRMHDMECLGAAEAIEASFQLPTPIDPK